MFTAIPSRALPRRHVLRTLAVACVAGAAVLGTGAALAQENFPSKPVKILVGSQAGGGVDAFSRIIAQKLQELWGQPVTCLSMAMAAWSRSSTAAASRSTASVSYTHLTLPTN